MAKAALREITPTTLRAILTEHWLVTVGCDHEAKTDTPVCACSRVNLGTHLSIRRAVEAWAAHVAAVAFGGATAVADAAQAVGLDRHGD